MIRAQLRELIYDAVCRTAGACMPVSQIGLEHPDLDEHGDYSTNVALVMAGDLKKNSRELAEAIVEQIKTGDLIEKVEVAGPGFINIWLQKGYLSSQISKVIKEGDGYGRTGFLAGKKIMVEYGHPNTHKEMHVGHMRTLITGEALARILEGCGAAVFRANYQGDVGPHVAKAVWGVRKILKRRGMGWTETEKDDLFQRAHLLGEGYVLGNQEYEANKEEIDALNDQLYKKDRGVIEDYERTRRWSLEYFDIFYRKFGVKFDRLFFESEVASRGKSLVEQNVGRVFEKSEGALVFMGENAGLHNRVFVTAAGNPTYEGKDMGLAMAQREAFQFDRNIHVVANEQTGYFKVIIKALELVDPWFTGRQHHLPMGMVNLVGKKISSRTGDVVTVDGLLKEVEGKLEAGGRSGDERVVVGAVKYALLRIHPSVDVAFDAGQSVSLEGNSGPYLQYTYARTQSVLAKTDIKYLTPDPSPNLGEGNQRGEVYNLEYNDEERDILRYLYRFEEVVDEAGEKLAPNLICNYLYELASRFNTFYNKHSILGADEAKTGSRQFRVLLTTAVGQVIKNGLGLLGIEAPLRM